MAPKKPDASLFTTAEACMAGLCAEDGGQRFAALAALAASTLPQVRAPSPRSLAR